VFLSNLNLTIFKVMTTWGLLFARSESHSMRKTAEDHAITP
jgi:hypothetical protein